MTADLDPRRLEIKQRELRPLVKDLKIDPEFFRLKTRVNKPKRSRPLQEETVHE